MGQSAWDRFMRLRIVEAGRETVAEVLSIMADPASFPSMFHCSAGKDRTGVLAAFLLSLLGVGDATIIEDYTRSAPAMTRLVAYFRASYPEARDGCSRLPPTMVAAHTTTMIEFLGGLRRDYGSVEQFVATLGVAEVIPV
jgi:protein-tyrosine phosphatase